MPFIRVTYPTHGLTVEQKAKLAPRLVEELIAQEFDPVTENGRNGVPLVFDELDERNCFPGGLPLVEHPERTFWIVEAMVAASFFNQARRDALQTAIAKAFVDVLGDDGSVIERGDLRIAPAYLVRLYTIIIEIPEGSWGAGGQTVETDKIGKILGGAQKKERLAELQENIVRLKATRVS